ncbi:hypothetical protein HJFPF1_13179 [Paramyrothecium foliicola]|nr:hypothetical protein HJFPF1_13179 [Paramyrothecium foliicola]
MCNNAPSSGVAQLSADLVRIVLAGLVPDSTDMATRKRSSPSRLIRSAVVLSTTHNWGLSLASQLRFDCLVQSAHWSNSYIVLIFLKVMMQHLFSIFLAAFAAPISPALAARSARHAPGHLLQGRSFLCPVVCDDTWCCQIGQTCQEASEGDAPFECADPLFETTDEAFALGPLSSLVESIVTDNSAFISSLTSRFSLSLAPISITSLPDPPEETTVSEGPVVSETPEPATTTSNPAVTTQERTSSAAAVASATSETELSESASITSVARATTEAEVPSATSVSEASEAEPSNTPVETSTSLSSSETLETTTTTEGGDVVTSTAPSDQGDQPSSETITTTTSDGAAATAYPQWQRGIGVVGLAMAMMI